MEQFYPRNLDYIETDLDPVEKGSVVDLQREVALKVDGDNFDKIRKLKKMLEDSP